MTILPNADYFKELLFYNLFTDKPKTKRLKNIDLTELRHPRKGLINMIKSVFMVPC